MWPCAVGHLGLNKGLWGLFMGRTKSGDSSSRDPPCGLQASGWRGWDEKPLKTTGNPPTHHLRCKKHHEARSRSVKCLPWKMCHVRLVVNITEEFEKHSWFVWNDEPSNIKPQGWTRMQRGSHKRRHDPRKGRTRRPSCRRKKPQQGIFCQERKFPFWNFWFQEITNYHKWQYIYFLDQKVLRFLIP